MQPRVITTVISMTTGTIVAIIVADNTIYHSEAYIKW